MEANGFPQWFAAWKRIRKAKEASVCVLKKKGGEGHEEGNKDGNRALHHRDTVNCGFADVDLHITRCGECRFFFVFF